tara:strand:- start:66833 stop:67036 length:204 start_codon:yes stop_codon:yes gene_type:complete
MYRILTRKHKPDIAIDLGTANTRIMTAAEGSFLTNRPYAVSPVISAGRSWSRPGLKPEKCGVMIRQT